MTALAAKHPRTIDRSTTAALPTYRRDANYVALLVAILLALLCFTAPPAGAVQEPVDLGTAHSFAVLAGSGITNTGPTTISGDVGTFPTTTVTGFGSVTLNGTNHGGDAVTQGAKDDLVLAYDDAFGRTPATNVAVELGGSTLLAGVYSSGTFGLTGTLTLDAEGDSDAEFIFQAGSTLIAEPNSRVLLLNGADPCRVVWQVGSSATFKTGTRFVGDVLAYTSITAQTGATFEGRLLALNGAVTLDTNTITKADCVAPVESSPTPSATTETPPATPTPAVDNPIPSATPSPIQQATASPSPTGIPMAGSGPGGPMNETPSKPSIPGLALTGLTILGLFGIGLALVDIGGIARRHGQRGRNAKTLA